MSNKAVPKKKQGLLHNIKQRQKKNISRSKKNTTISSKNYNKMKTGKWT